MATEIYKEKVYGNFRKRFPEKRKPAFEERDGMDSKHCALIRLMPCCVTLVQPAGTIHHLKSGPAAKERGVGLRATDRWGIPMSWDSHAEIERIGSRKERQWFLDRGIDPHDLAVSLWNGTGDLERMVKILLAHREHFAEID